MRHRILVLASATLLCLTVLGLPRPDGALALVSTVDGGWHWLNPLPQGNDLNDLAFVSSKLGWSVGADGTVLVTRNGGVTWTPQYPRTSNDLLGVDFIDAGRGWAVGTEGVIIATRDGGRTWSRQRSGTSAQLEAVAFANASCGWAVGGNGTLLRTANGGRSWRQQALPAPPFSGSSIGRLNDVHSVDARHGWVVGDHGLILATGNGGRTWRLQAWRGNQVNLMAVSFADADHGWAVGLRGGGSHSDMTGVPTAFATADGGTTWSPISDVSGTDLSFSDARHGWVLASDQLLATLDGGVSWTSHSLPAPYERYNALSFVGARRGWLVGWSGALARTQDGGITWSRADRARSTVGLGREYPSQLSFVDARHGWAIAVSSPYASTGTVFATSNGGLTWRAQLSPSVPLSAICFADRRHGWVVGRATIMRTSNGGRSWQDESPWSSWDPDVRAHVTDVSFVDARHGWASAGGGLVWRTSNGGDTWRAQTTGTQDNLAAVQFVTARQGWVLTATGMILHTTDGGVSWTIHTPGGNDAVPPTIRAMSFVDARHGWAVGGIAYSAISDSVFVTSNGGATWRRQYRPAENGSSGSVRTRFGDVCFVNARDGWVERTTSHDDTIMATRNGGRTWVKQDPRAGELLGGGLTFIDARHGWVLSEHGFLSTSTGGFGPATRNAHGRLHHR